MKVLNDHPSDNIRSNAFKIINFQTYFTETMCKRGRTAEKNLAETQVRMGHVRTYRQQWGETVEAE